MNCFDEYCSFFKTSCPFTLGIITLILLFLLDLLFFRKRSCSIKQNNNNGTTVLKQVALKSFIRKILSSYKEINIKKIYFNKYKKETYKITLHIQLLSHVNLAKLSNQIEETVFQKFEEQFSITSIKKVDFIVNNIVNTSFKEKKNEEITSLQTSDFKAEEDESLLVEVIEDTPKNSIILKNNNFNKNESENQNKDSKEDISNDQETSDDSTKDNK